MGFYVKLAIAKLERKPIFKKNNLFNNDIESKQKIIILVLIMIG